MPARQRDQPPPVLMRARRLRREEMPGPGHLSQQAFIRQEIARGLALRVIALDWLGIGGRSRGWKDRYIAALEERAFPGFKLEAARRRRGRPSQEDDSERLLIVARLLSRAAGNASSDNMAETARTLAEERLGPEATRDAVRIEAGRLLEVYKYWRRSRRD